jgi:hypothetical protein
MIPDIIYIYKNSCQHPTEGAEDSHSEPRIQREIEKNSLGAGSLSLPGLSMVIFSIVIRIA